MSYKKDGYVIIPNVLAKTDCEAIVQLAKKHADEDFRPILNLEDKEPLLNEIVVHDPQIMGHIREILGENIKPIGSIFHFKEPGTIYAKQAWNAHQDISYIKAEYGKCVSAILILSYTDKGNGGLYVYPGSHREPLLKFDSVPSFETSSPGNRVSLPRKYFGEFKSPKFN